MEEGSTAADIKGPAQQKPVPRPNFRLCYNTLSRVLYAICVTRLHMRSKCHAIMHDRAVDVMQTSAGFSRPEVRLVLLSSVEIGLILS